MADQAEFIDNMREVTELLFAHRKFLRRIKVRLAFWPEGLVIGCTISARSNQETLAGRQQIVPWAELKTIDPAVLIAIVDRVCQPAHDVLGTTGTT